MTFLKKYFPNGIEYPDPTKIMMEPGWLLSYISSDFLSPWLNYLEILDTYLITRYREYQVNVERAQAFNSKIEAGDCFFHQNVSLFGDDVLVLAKEKPSTKYEETSYPLDYRNKPELSGYPADTQRYWFFWFDQDSSDSCLGRFYVASSQEAALRQEFQEYCSERMASFQEASLKTELHKPLYLKLHQVKGWLSG